MTHTRTPAPSHRLVLALLLCTCLAARADRSQPSAAPTLYADAPLAAQQNGSLNLAGTNLADIAQATYQVVTDGVTNTQQADLVAGLEHGDLKIVARNTNPERLTVKWPTGAHARKIYAVRVRNSSGQWSNAVMVNQPQPAWFSPAMVSSSSTLDPLPRRLQIIGRNLNDNLQARLSGQAIISLLPSAVATDERSDLALLSYDLPTHISVGQYRVEYSTDGQHWLAVGGQRLEVRQSTPRSEIRLDDRRFGACRADDLRDDSACFLKALRTAMREKSAIALPAGQWDIYQEGTSVPNGIVVPQGVWLRGDEKEITTLMQHSSNDSSARPLLSLSGSNRIEHLWLRNATGKNAPLVQIGIKTSDQSTMDNEISDIELLANRFTHATTAIIDAGSSMRHLIVVDNEFSIDGTALYLAGNRYRTTSRFRLVDSVITGNVFRATAKPARPEQAPIASEIGGSLRLNFSGNRALADSVENSGWRAGFFFHLIDSHENLLVHNNTVQCAGSGGDGEAIALDNNGNTYPYQGMQSITAADAASVTIANTPMSLQNGRAVPNGYYVGHWLQVVAGDGNGQARRITSYVVDASGATRFSISPEFAAIPITGHSKAIISRLFHEPTVIGNIVDNRNPGCARTNRSGPQGGAISLWAQTHGALVAGNAQYNSDGIVAQHAYAVPSRGCEGCEISVIRHVALNIIGNKIVDEYDWSSSCSQSGIQFRHGAAPTPDYPPPVLGLNGKIADNHITHADGLRGGAITFPLSWHAGPARFSGALIDGTLIEGNLIDNLSGAPPAGKCSSVTARIGINLPAGSLVHGTTLHNNQCRQVSSPLVDRAVNTLRLCADTNVNTCECARQRID